MMTREEFFEILGLMGLIKTGDYGMARHLPSSGSGASDLSITVKWGEKDTNPTLTLEFGQGLPLLTINQISFYLAADEKYRHEK